MAVAVMASTRVWERGREGGGREVGGREGGREGGGREGEGRWEGGRKGGRERNAVTMKPSEHHECTVEVYRHVCVPVG